MTRDAVSGMETEPRDPLARDPVCGRTFPPERAKAETEYGGETWFFCSPECHRAFTSDPARYASEGRTGAGDSRVPWPGWPPTGGGDEP